MREFRTEYRSPDAVIIVFIDKIEKKKLAISALFSITFNSALRPR